MVEVIPNYYNIVGVFVIVHQSPGTVYLKQDGSSVPLYCVATTHSLKHTYTWKEDTTSLSASSPVLWVNKPGAYRCTVKESDGPSCRECVSTEINLKGMYEYAVISLYHSPCHPVLYLALVHEEEEEDCKITQIDGPARTDGPAKTSSPYNKQLQDSYVQGQVHCI